VSSSGRIRKADDHLDDRPLKPAFAEMLKSFWPVCLLLISAVSPRTALGSPRQTVVGFEPDMISVLLKPPIRDRKTLILEGAELQGEVTSEAAADQSGWRSMRVTLDISCAARGDRVRSMEVFTEHNAQGVGKILTPPTNWIAPSPHTYGWDTVAYLCGPARQGEAVHAALPQVDTSERSPTAPEIPEKAQTPPEKSDPPAPARSNVDRAGSASVQVGSTTVEADAAAILAKLKGLYGSSFTRLQTRIEKADVHGQTHFRAIVFGFPDAAAAGSFCSAAHPANGCIVRRGS
jgi:hypothetical protein